MSKKIFFVIPAYNEERAIGKVIDDLKRTGYTNLVIIDDCSNDKTSEIVKSKDVFLLQHLINRGQGAALKTGIDFALEHRADYIVTFDSDGQHRISDLPQMLKPVLDGRVDVTLGSRFLKKESIDKVYPLKKFMLKIAVLFMLVMYGIKLSDAHNGYRVLSRRAASKIQIKCDRMEHASEIVEEIYKNKIRFKEVPVTIEYTDYSRAKGQSHFNSVRIAIKLILRKLFN